MRQAAVALARGAFNLIYRVGDRKDRLDEVVFLSRQTNNPSYDFRELAAEFEHRGWTATMHLKKVSKRNLPSYALHVLKELRLLGRCKIAVLDRYDPVVSLLNFECEASPSQNDGRMAPDAANPSATPVNTDFPKKPVVLQVWHAFGAYKKFGHQSVGTLEGHSAEFTSTFSIHRNYSWVVCSGAGAREEFAEAFACPPERVVAMDRPEYDELSARKAERHRAETFAASSEETLAKKPFKVLMAPTLRKSHDSAHPFRSLYQDRARFEALLGDDFEVCWLFHPLESGLPAPGNVSQRLLECDCLVTDYSSIVYEAFLLGIPTLFYVPDLEQYRLSPGLNVDPEHCAPDLCFKSPASLARAIARVRAQGSGHALEQLDEFAASAFEIDVPRDGTAASRLVDFALKAL